MAVVLHNKRCTGRNTYHKQWFCGMEGLVVLAILTILTVLLRLCGSWRLSKLTSRPNIAKYAGRGLSVVMGPFLHAGLRERLDAALDLRCVL